MDEFGVQTGSAPVGRGRRLQQNTLLQSSHRKQVPVLIDKEEIHFRELHVPTDGENVSWQRGNRRQTSLAT